MFRGLRTSPISLPKAFPPRGRLLRALLLVAFCALSPLVPAGQDSTWRDIEPGLQVAAFEAPIKSTIGESVIHVVRIDTAYFDFRLLCASQHGGKSRTAPQWCKEFRLVAAVNASMFAADGLTSTGLLIADRHVNNGQINPGFGAVFVFHPKRTDLPRVQLVYRQCDDFESLRPLYHSMVQNYRILTCKGHPAWKQSDRIYSQVAVGMDDGGRVLFVLSRSPYSVHDFARNLLRLRIGIRRAMYCEGGPEASLYVKSGDYELRLVGSYETGFWDQSNAKFWPIPNVLGVVRR